MRYTVIGEQEADGVYVASVPALPGCVSQGDSRDEVMTNIREAAALYIQDCIAAGDPLPTEAGREYFELTAGNFWPYATDFTRLSTSARNRSTRPNT